MMCLCTCHGSSTPGCLPLPHQIGWEVLPSTIPRVSAHPKIIIFEAQSPGPHMPLPTLHLAPHDAGRTARGESCWLAFPFCGTYTRYTSPVSLALRNDDLNINSKQLHKQVAGGVAVIGPVSNEAGYFPINLPQKLW